MEQERITRMQYRKEILGVQRAKKVTTDYKSMFLAQLALAGFPEPIPEHSFTPHRRWRFDWAFLTERIAIEYQGGNYTGKSGHSTIKGLRNDYEKITAASLYGWILILIDSETVRTGRALQWIELAMQMRAGIATDHQIRSVLAKKPKKPRKRRAAKRIVAK